MKNSLIVSPTTPSSCSLASCKHTRTCLSKCILKKVQCWQGWRDAFNSILIIESAVIRSLLGVRGSRLDWDEMSFPTSIIMGVPGSYPRSHLLYLFYPISCVYVCALTHACVCAVFIWVWVHVYTWMCEVEASGQPQALLFRGCTHPLFF